MPAGALFLSVELLLFAEADRHDDVGPRLPIPRVLPGCVIGVAFGWKRWERQRYPDFG